MVSGWFNSAWQRKFLVTDQRLIRRYAKRYAATDLVSAVIKLVTSIRCAVLGLRPFHNLIADQMRLFVKRGKLLATVHLRRWAHSSIG